MDITFIDLKTAFGTIEKKKIIRLQVSQKVIETQGQVRGNVQIDKYKQIKKIKIEKRINKKATLDLPFLQWIWIEHSKVQETILEIFKSNEAHKSNTGDTT